MGGFTAQFVGLKELEAKLSELKTTTAHKVVRQGLLDGGKVIQAAVRERAPVRPPMVSGTAIPPGALAADIELVFGHDDDGLPAAIVEPGRYTGHVARWVEYGHRLVKGGRSSMKRGRLQGRGHQVGDVPAHPFIRLGYESSRAEAVAIAIESIKSGIEKAAKK